MYMLYSTLFLPYLLYCVEIWGNTYPTNLHCIIILQKSDMHNAQRCDHTMPLFHKARILKFTELVQFRILIFTYKAHKMNYSSNIKIRLFVRHVKSTVHGDK